MISISNLCLMETTFAGALFLPLQMDEEVV